MQINTPLIYSVAATLALSIVMGASPRAASVMLQNRIGPSKEELFIANADGSAERPLLPEKDRAFDYSASFSTDGAWIIFTSERDADGTGQADLYRVHPDGTGLEQLTNDPAVDDQGVLSPDGKWIAFVSTRGPNHTANIWVMDMSNRKARNLTGDAKDLQAPDGTMHSFFRPAWSPDQKWIAFSSDRANHFTGVEFGAGVGHSQGLSLYIMHPDGTGIRRLTIGGVVADGSPRWSIDGKRLVFYEIDVADTMNARMYGTPSSQIVSMDVSSGVRTVHTSGPGLKVAPQFLGPDRIGYLVKSAPKESGVAPGLAYLRGGAAPTAGPAGMVRNPSWSADATQVVYQRFDITNRAQNTRLHSWDPTRESRYTDVFPEFNHKGTRLAVTDLNFPFGNPDASISVMDPDGSNRLRIFHQQDGAAMTPSWSPDDQWIAFSYGSHFGARSAKPANIMMVRADGSEAQNITDGPPNSGFPTWSPDGKSMVYRVWGGTDIRGLRLMNLSNHSVETLTTEWDNFPFYSPSGDRIVFTRQKKSDQDFDVFSMKADGTDVKQLTFSAGSDGHATWTADGRELWFYSSRSGFKDEASLYDMSPQPYAQVFLMNRDGSNVRQITDSRWEDSMAVYVPYDKKKLVTKVN